MLDHPLDDLFDEGQAGLELGFPTIVQKGEADAGDAFQTGFHGRAHGAAVQNVDARVAAVVDATQTEIGFLILKNDALRQFDTIDRSAAAFVGANVRPELIALFEPEGFVQGNGVSLSALRAVRCYHRDGTKTGRDRYEVFEAGGGDAVVVG